MCVDVRIDEGSRVPRGVHPADMPRRFRRGHRKQSVQ